MGKIKVKIKINANILITAKKIFITAYLLAGPQLM